MSNNKEIKIIQPEGGRACCKKFLQDLYVKRAVIKFEWSEMVQIKFDKLNRRSFCNPITEDLENRVKRKYEDL